MITLQRSVTMAYRGIQVVFCVTKRDSWRWEKNDNDGQVGMPLMAQALN